MLGDAEQLEAAFAAGADLDSKDPEHGDTALIKAALNGHLECVQLLLQCDADVMVTNVDGETALACAEKREHVDIIRLLKAAMEALNSGKGKVKLDWAHRGDDLWFWATGPPSALQPGCALFVSPDLQRGGTGGPGALSLQLQRPTG